jgi:hypothetical protein
MVLTSGLNDRLLWDARVELKRTEKFPAVTITERVVRGDAIK